MVKICIIILGNKKINTFFLDRFISTYRIVKNKIK